MATRPANSTSQEVFITALGNVNLPVPTLVNESVVPVTSQKIAPYVTAAGTIATPGDVTCNIALGTIDAGSGVGAVLNIKGVTLAVCNSTDQALTNLVLSFYETVGGQTITISYAALPGGTLAGSLGTMSVYVPCSDGVLKTVKVVPTWGTTPTLGVISVQAVFHT